VSAMAVAVRNQDWERVALYLLLGVSRAAEKLPPETLDALLDLLSADESREKRRVR
jgi:hypothetical protein